MKKFLLLAALVLAAATPAVRAQTTTAAEDELAALLDHAHVTRGMNPEAVQLMLGQPHAKVGDNVWIYLDFQAKGKVARSSLDALVVAFRDGRVETIRLTESQPVKDYLASLERRNVRVNIAKK